jgi:hypothetical protein
MEFGGLFWGNALIYGVNRVFSPAMRQKDTESHYSIAIAYVQPYSLIKRFFK